MGEAGIRLLRGVSPAVDHVRGGGARDGVITVVSYGDFLCPYCRRFRLVFKRLREVFGEKLAYAFRHFPNERAHPGAEFAACAAEAAANQDRFWEMHDALFDREPSMTMEHICDIARELGLDMERFVVDVKSDDVRARVAASVADARATGVTGTPTFFIDGQRYDGAWDFYSMMETLQKPVAQRLTRTARVFAALPASGGLVLLLAAALALLCANSPLAPYYSTLIHSAFGIGPPGGLLSLTVGEWASEGLLGVFFLLVGLEIRREMTAGSLADPRAAALPIIGAIGGGIAPAIIFLALNQGATAKGWAVPTATDIAFVLGILALLGPRVSTGLRVFIAALAVVDDVLSVLTLAIFYPRNFEVSWLVGCGIGIAALYALNRARVYSIWPYMVVTCALWFALHSAGVHGALAGVFLAAFLPTRPEPVLSPLLAQAATALAALEHAENEAREAKAKGLPVEEDDPTREWATRNLSAASERLLSPADRVERAVSPWSSYVALPLFAFSATGVALSINLSAPGATHVFIGTVLGLLIGKPLGICLASLIAVTLRVAKGPSAVSLQNFIGAACLCGIGDTVALLMADQAFPGDSMSSVAKIGVLVGSLLAAALGSAVILTASAKEVADATPVEATA